MTFSVKEVAKNIEALSSTAEMLKDQVQDAQLVLPLVARAPAKVPSFSALLMVPAPA